MTQQGLTAPIAGDVTKQPMLDFVPLARARWKMANLQLQVQVVRQFLQRHLPQTAPAAIAAATVRRDHQFVGTRKALSTHVLPPAPDAVGCEMSGIMIDADADPALVVGQVV